MLIKLYQKLRNKNFNNWGDEPYINNILHYKIMTSWSCSGYATDTKTLLQYYIP